MLLRSWSIAALILLISLPLQAATTEVQGVSLPQRVELAGEQLQLNGAGLRQRLVFRVYVGSLYLPQRSSNIEQVLAMSGPKRIQLNLLRNVDQATLAEAIRDGFANNLSAIEQRRFANEIRQFAAMFDQGRQGDEVRIDFIPGTGVQVWHAGRDRGVIAGDEFHRAVLRIWLGEQPADERLKQGMLGR